MFCDPSINETVSRVKNEKLENIDGESTKAVSAPIINGAETAYREGVAESLLLVSSVSVIL